MTLDLLCGKRIKVIHAQTGNMLQNLGWDGIDRLIADMPQINRANRLAMFLITPDERLSICKTETPCKKCQRLRIGGHRIGLLVMHDLQIMFDCSHQCIAVRQDAGFLIGQETMPRKAWKDLKRSAAM